VHLEAYYNKKKLIPVTARSQAWVCVLSFTGIVGLNPAGENGCLFLVSVVWYRVEIFESGRSFVQRSPAVCGVSNECDRKAP